MEKIIQSVKGTRDFYPEEMAARTWLYGKLKEVSKSYGYQEYEAPFLEKIDLYAAKSGEELVKEQAFVFPDRSGDLITLRPELTPSLARMVAQRQQQLVYPLRWWSFGPFWRYEKPQRGRTREFFQWNIDLIGPNSPESDAELISVCASFFRKVGLTAQQVKISVNDRRLMDAQLTRLGLDDREKKKAVFRLIDRRDKLSAASWQNYALELGLDESQFERLKAILDDQNLWEQSQEMVRLFQALEALDAMAYVRYNPQVIRGLEYYTGTVFEAHDIQAEGRAILGGGRYDNLVGEVGGDPLAGVGFAMGDVMVTLLLKNYGLIPAEVEATAQALVTVFDESLLANSLRVAHQLRSAGIRAECFTETQKLQRQLKFADRTKVRFVVIIGPDEQQAGTATVKDLRQGGQQTLPQAKLAEYIQGKLENKEVENDDFA